MFNVPSSPAEVSAALSDHDYLTDEGLATVVYLSMSMERPLFLEGDAGVGKTELAKVLSALSLIHISEPTSPERIG